MPLHIIMLQGLFLFGSRAEPAPEEAFYLG